MSEAGVVLYRRTGRTFEGVWTHPEMGGLLAREVVHGVEEGSFEGVWKVDIYLPGSDAVFFKGRLTSTLLGKAYLLSWSGHDVVGGKARKFTGIGLSQGSDEFVTSFQEVSSPPE